MVINRPVKCSVSMKCTHPGCLMPVLPEAALFLYLETIEERLGRPARLGDLHNFAVHNFHGYGTACEFLVAQIMERQNAKPVSAKEPIDVTKNRAVALNVSYRLNPAEVQEAVIMSRTEGIEIKAAMEHVLATRHIKALIAKHGLNGEEVRRAYDLTRSKDISLEAAMARIATGKRLRAAKARKAGRESAAAQWTAHILAST